MNPDDDLPRDRVQDTIDTITVFLGSERGESVREDVRDEIRDALVRLRDPGKSSELPPPRTVKLGDLVREILDTAHGYDSGSIPTKELDARLSDTMTAAVRTAIRDMVEEVEQNESGAPTPSTESPTPAPGLNDLKDAEAVRDAFGDGEIELPRKENGRVDYSRLVYLLHGRDGE